MLFLGMALTTGSIFTKIQELTGSVITQYAQSSFSSFYSCDDDEQVSYMHTLLLVLMQLKVLFKCIFLVVYVFWYNGLRKTKFKVLV